MTGSVGQFLAWLEGFLWNAPFILFVLAVGLYFLVFGRFFVIRHLGHIFKHTIGALFAKESGAKREGYISPFEAACVAVGGCVGVGSVAGVATAIVIGGPGAAFWLVIFGFFAMAIKLCEASLASYYRNRDEKGHFTGGPMWYMEKGIGREMGKKYGFALASVFCFAFLCLALQGSQAYTMAEVLHSVYGFDMILVTVLYTVLIYVFIWRGLPGVARLASKAVPFMCVVFMAAGLGIIIANYEQIPAAVALICHDAFTGTAAVGGFAGASVVAALRSGISRSVNSNEAGQGTAAFAHSTADTVHPIRQGLWSSFDAFITTVVICNITALVIVITGLWDSGAAGGTLTYMAYKTQYGELGGWMLSGILVLFALTTTTGAYVYYTMVLEYLFRRHPIARARTLLAFKLIFPAINVAIVSYISLTGNGPVMFWTIVSIVLVPGIFINLLSLFLLRKKFFTLLKDYKARYLGLGTVDPDFRVFYEDDPEVYRREEAFREEMRQLVKDREMETKKAA